MPKFRHRLNLQMFAGEKTEKATPRKRRQARRKGQVASSHEVTSSVILLAALGLFFLMGPYLKNHLLRMFGEVYLNWLDMDVTAQNIMPMFYRFLMEMLLFMAPIFILAILVTVAVNYAQIGWLFTLEPLKFNLKRLNPIQGLKNLFRLRSLVELAKSVLKLAIIGLAIYGVLMSRMDEILSLAHMPIEGAFSFVGKLVLQMGVIVAILLFILSIGDYAFAKYEYEKSLRMSKQDIKDEIKDTEGDPRVKGRIRERQRRMAIMRMMQEVPKADVVITNPTHYAVALKYDSAKMDAPVVVAKGVDYMALKIRETAKKHDVVIMENRPLARALYERTEIGEMIPTDLFQAVAEVLAYVYRLKGRKQA